MGYKIINMHMCDPLHAYTHKGTLVYSLIWRMFVVCTEFHSKEILGWVQSLTCNSISFFLFSLFQYLFHPRVTAVARKRPRSFCQKCRQQVTAKHTCTLCMWLCMKWHGTWLYGVHKTRQGGSSFMWHQPRQCCKYTTLVDIKEHALKSYSLV